MRAKRKEVLIDRKIDRYQKGAVWSKVGNLINASWKQAAYNGYPVTHRRRRAYFGVCFSRVLKEVRKNETRA